MPRVGDPAPELKTVTDEGKGVSLKEFRGKRVVLHFYPRGNTAGCTREASPSATIAGRRLHAARCPGVGTDTVDSHATFKRKHELPFPLLADPERRLVRAYGVWKRKTIYSKTSMGERTMFIIDEEGTISYVFSLVKTDGHVDQVLTAPGGTPSTG